MFPYLLLTFCLFISGIIVETEPLRVFSKVLVAAPMKEKHLHLSLCPGHSNSNSKHDYFEFQLLFLFVDVKTPVLKKRKNE